MGLISDILEDSAEQLGQFLDTIYRVPDNLPPRQDHFVKNIDCPSCALSFTSEAQYQNHIFVAHRNARFYVKVNDQVIKDLIYVAEVPKSLTVTVIDGSCRAEMTIGESHQISEIGQGNPTDLSSYLPGQFSGVITLVIHLGSYSREFKIYCTEKPWIDRERLDAIVKELQIPLLQGCEPNWTEFQRAHIHRAGANRLEADYMSGFFEYLYGSYLDGTDYKQAGPRHEQAFGYLRPFHTSLAHTARCILALKMNWFSMLRYCKSSSKFHLPNVFFNEGPQTPPFHIPIPPSFKGAIEGLWIDSFQETYLEALRMYYSEDFQSVKGLVAKLKKQSHFNDRNNEDKLVLLEARSFLAEGDKAAAVHAYEFFIHHPVFGTESDKVREKWAK